MPYQYQSAPRPYDYSGGNRISDLLLRGGQIQAEGIRNRGAILGDAIQGIGKTVGEGISSFMEAQKKRKQEEAATSVIQSWDGSDPRTLLTGLVKAIGPEAGPRLAATTLAYHGVARKEQAQDAAEAEAILERKSEQMKRVIEDWPTIPEALKQASWPGLRANAPPLVERLYGLPADQVAQSLPEQLTPEVDQMISQLGKMGGRFGPKPIITPPGHGITDPRTGETTVPVPVAEKPETRGLDVQAADALRAGDRATYELLMKAKKDMGQADDRPRQFVPVVIQTENGPQILDRSTGTTRGIVDSGGGAVRPAPTADMRNKEAGRAFVAKSINAIESLSEKILTRVGPGQRAAAIARGAASVFGSDPEFKTYQDARMALAGNLAVAQQGSRPSDADIKAIWLPLVPDPYRDTSESSAMKWDLIKTMSNVPGRTSQPPQSAQQPGPSATKRRYTVEEE